MKTRRVVAVLVVVFNIVGYAGPCINCTASLNSNQNKVVKHDGKGWSSKSTDYNPDEMISLDNNEGDYEYDETIEEENDNIIPYQNIVLIDESSGDGSTKILYACDDFIDDIVTCDEENKDGCECV